MLPGQLEQVLHQLLAAEYTLWSSYNYIAELDSPLSQPLGHQVRAGHGEESRVVGLGGHSLRQEGLTSPCIIVGVQE